MAMKFNTYKQQDRGNIITKTIPLTKDTFAGVTSQNEVLLINIGVPSGSKHNVQTIDECGSPVGDVAMSKGGKYLAISYPDLNCGSGIVRLYIYSRMRQAYIQITEIFNDDEETALYRYGTSLIFHDFYEKTRLWISSTAYSVMTVDINDGRTAVSVLQSSDLGIEFIKGANTENGVLARNVVNKDLLYIWSDDEGLVSKHLRRLEGVANSVSVTASGLHYATTDRKVIIYNPDKDNSVYDIYKLLTKQLRLVVTGDMRKHSVTHGQLKIHDMKLDPSGVRLAILYHNPLTGCSEVGVMILKYPSTLPQNTVSTVVIPAVELSQDNCVNTIDYIGDQLVITYHEYVGGEIYNNIMIENTSPENE